MGKRGGCLQDPESQNGAHPRQGEILGGNDIQDQGGRRQKKAVDHRQHSFHQHHCPPTAIHALGPTGPW